MRSNAEMTPAPVSEGARRATVDTGAHGTVALSGDGDDELSAGYNLYRAEKAARYFGRLPHWLGEGVIGGVADLIPESTRYINRSRAAREFIHAARLDTRGRYEMEFQGQIRSQA